MIKELVKILYLLFFAQSIIILFLIGVTENYFFVFIVLFSLEYKITSDIKILP